MAPVEMSSKGTTKDDLSCDAENGVSSFGAGAPDGIVSCNEGTLPNDAPGIDTCDGLSFGRDGRLDKMGLL